jgi:hypothetical protein
LEKKIKFLEYFLDEHLSSTSYQLVPTQNHDLACSEWRRPPRLWQFFAFPQAFGVIPEAFNEFNGEW